MFLETSLTGDWLKICDFKFYGSMFGVSIPNKEISDAFGMKALLFCVLRPISFLAYREKSWFFPDKFWGFSDDLFDGLLML